MYRRLKGMILLLAFLGSILAFGYCGRKDVGKSISNARKKYQAYTTKCLLPTEKPKQRAE